MISFKFEQFVDPKLAENQYEAIMAMLQQISEDVGVSNSTANIEDLEQVAALVGNFVRKLLFQNCTNII